MIDVQAALDRAVFRNHRFSLSPYQATQMVGLTNLRLTISFVDEDLREPHAPAKTWLWEVPVPVSAVTADDVFLDWVLTELIRSEVHEICEGFHVDGEPLVDPHTDARTWSVGTTCL